jgi:mannose-6-phosphate isomerase-like protein (cupin superfamily)
MNTGRIVSSTLMATLVIASASVVHAQQWPPGIDLDWPDEATFLSADALGGLAAELAPQAKASGRHVAAKPLLATRTHAVFAIHRDATGQVEQHQGMTDYWIVTSGEGTLVLGGEVVEREEVGPGEYRGTSIEGGREVPVKPGDQIDIPPNVPHQIIIEEGKSITYLILKINIGMYPWSFLR